MITCYLQYEIDPRKLAEFEAYAKTWVALVSKFGGVHHGYLLPHEGPNDIAVASFSFPNLAEYEQYRKIIQTDEECQNAFEFARKTECIRRYTRYFMRPIFEGEGDAVNLFNTNSK